jgi:hypothetical protein
MTRSAGEGAPMPNDPEARAFRFTNLRSGEGGAAVVVWLTEQFTAPANRRRALIDAHAPYVAQPHPHSHEHPHAHDARDHPHPHSR